MEIISSMWQAMYTLITCRKLFLLSSIHLLNCHLFWNKSDDLYAACERVVQCSLTLYLALCCLLHKNDKLVGKWGGWNIYMLYESSVSLATIELFFLPTRVPPLLPKSDGLLPHHWCRCCLHHRHAHPDGALSQPYQAHWRWHALLGGLVGLTVDV